MSTTHRGLEDSVQILRDRLGIPHVRARTTMDAFFGQGFAHAQDRLWQMEYDRRRAEGRLAEYIPRPARITMDAFSRRMGLAVSARADVDALDDESRAVLTAYAAGVNAFIGSGAPVPREFELLGITAEPWEPWHCAAVLKVRHVLMGLYDYKLWRARLAHVLGPEGLVRPGSPDGREDLLIVPVGGRATWTAADEEYSPFALASAGTDRGSNNWAVHGSRTASGAPLVAGDPHRTIDVPNVYYQNHLACPDFDAIGFSMPGTPGMFHFAHNTHVAWCITHAYADTQDLYVERFREDGSYEFRGEWLPSECRTETIRVRGGDDVEIGVTTTHHGPVIFGDPSTGTAISLRWTGTDRPDTSLRTILPTLRSRSVAELDEVMRDWVDPGNSMVMADRSGTIGYVHRGRVPVRSRANGWLPVPGWTGEHEWDGDVPYDEMPRLRDPEAGFIVTANNRVCSPDFPHYLGMDYTTSARAMRIFEHLRALEDATAGDMAMIHADRVSLAAPFFVNAVNALEGLEGLHADARDRLASWDIEMQPDAVGATLYAATRDRLAAVLTEREPLRSVSAYDPYAEEPFPTPVHTRARAALPRLIAQDDRSLLDGAEWRELIAEAFARAVDELADRFGPDVDGWTWGRAHVTVSRHPLSVLFPAAADVLDPPVVGCGGDGECVNAGSQEIGLGVASSSVARYVFDLGDWDNSAWIVPHGSSGDPSSPHYGDQSEDWAQLRLRPMLFSWDRVEADAESRQVLEPER